MASAFNTTISDLENELMQLIVDGHINARIDSHSKVMNERMGILTLNAYLVFFTELLYIELGRSCSFLISLMAEILASKFPPSHKGSHHEPFLWPVLLLWYLCAIYWIVMVHTMLCFVE